MDLGNREGFDLSKNQTYLNDSVIFYDGTKIGYRQNGE